MARGAAPTDRPDGPAQASRRRRRAARDPTLLHDQRCLRQVHWLLDEGVVADASGSGPAPCAEPCSLLTSFCREVIGWRRGEEVADGALLRAFVELAGEA